KPELRIIPNRERASDLGVNIQSIASTVQTLVGGQIVSDFKDNQLGELYDVWLRAVGIDRNDRRGIENLTLATSKKIDNATGAAFPGVTSDTQAAKLIKLSNVATLIEDR